MADGWADKVAVPAGDSRMDSSVYYLRGADPMASKLGHLCGSSSQHQWSSKKTIEINRKKS
ncbi:hypothetical protein E2562_018751 [Oryza meyeriana var. granulata]|uniref:Uncharacterized protein n=1 Tax=Oryza meyeriana var. granulata TaxID=110450 RepID=A0A6G1EMV2_9ORYZ|nr:hypothetical protein E2562_018751 [Oryza meyeriana var. granulata]